MPNPTGKNQYSRGGKKKSGGLSKAGISKTHVQTAGGGSISKAAAAAKMFGSGSKQHKAALKRFGS